MRGYHARMARRAQHLLCSLRRECERSERADNKLDKVRGRKVKSRDCALASDLVKALTS